MTPIETLLWAVVLIGSLVLAVLLAVLWIILPFAVFRLRREAIRMADEQRRQSDVLRAMLAEAGKTNRHLARVTGEAGK